MPDSTGVYWDALFEGDSTRILKALYGTVLQRDWFGPLTALNDFSLFDSETGNLRSDLLTASLADGGGWVDLGYQDEDGVQFAPKYTTVDTMVWQSRMAQRTDVTLDQETAQHNNVESLPVLDYINYQLPIMDSSGVSLVPKVGTVDYRLLKPNVPQLTYRQSLFIGVDGRSGENEYFATLYSRSLMTKPDKYQYSAKKEIETPFTWEAYPDPSSGFAVARFREGPAWRAAGGSTSAPGTPVATAETGLKAQLVFSEPDSSNGPFTYAVVETTGGAPTDVPAANVTVVSTVEGEVTLLVSGLVASSSYTFQVKAIGSNLAMSLPSVASNSITAES